MTAKTKTADIFSDDEMIDEAPETVYTAPAVEEEDIYPTQVTRRSGGSEYYKLFWSNGLPIDGKENEDGTQMKFSGWYANESAELDPILEARKAPMLGLLHASSKRVVNHYVFKSLKVIPLITGGLPTNTRDGFPGDRTLDRDPNTQWFGTSCGWRASVKSVNGERVATGKNETFLNLPVIFPSLVDAYGFPIVLSTRATVTENMARLIEHHVAACVRAAEILNIRIPCYGMYLTIGIGAPESKGRSDTVKLPVPEACVNVKGGGRTPTLPDIDDDASVKEWYEANRAAASEIALARGYVRNMVDWSREESIRMIRGL